MQKKYRVLHIFSGYGGGISSLILNLIENRTEEFEFATMAFSYKNGEHFVKKLADCETKCYTMPRPSESGYKRFKDYVNKVMRAGNYDAVHCHIAGFHAIPFEIAARKNKINNFILHAHTTHFDSGIDRNRLTYMIGQYLNYRMSSCYMTCSDMAGDYVFGEKYLEKRKAYLIPNGIKKEVFLDDITEREKENYMKEFGVDDNTTIILHVGRFSNPKNHEFIVDIAEKAEKEKKDFMVLLVGDGELFGPIKNKINKLHLANRIRQLGRRLDISKLMQFADCMILPSFYEGLPTVAVECQAAGTKIIISDKVTKQCDMGLGLVDFLPIDNVTPWINALKEINFGHLPVKDCVEAIEKNGFTASAAGIHYCNILNKCIDKQGVGRNENTICDR